jgi:hypothetical protein
MSPFYDALPDLKRNYKSVQPADASKKIPHNLLAM